jgi:peptide-methionine (S)-S-oxide reductase
MNDTRQAIFAAGCFWGIEAAFLRVPGVTDARSGYTGGTTEHPTYEAVCSGRTGHAEAVQVSYDPSVVSYETLVRAFFAMHDPTQVNRQGPDIGTQYRSAIFYATDSERKDAECVRDELSATHDAPIATEITEQSVFWPAEEYHQRYFEKHPNAVCHI